MTAITKAMVLAAGLGTRMRHLSETTPKPLVRLAGRALIDHCLDRLAAAGISEAVVNVHYMADALEAHLDGRTRPRIRISDERTLLLDTGGGVKRALPHFGASPFIIHNSDSIWLENGWSNLAALIGAWDDAHMDALLLLAPRETSLGYAGRGDFHLGEDGRLRRRTGNETAAFVFAGVSIAHPRLFEGVRDDTFSLNRVWDTALADGRAYGCRHRGLWMHVGTPEALAEAEAAFLSAPAAAC
jgi:MurNAc alpha-1-phosphate uridylyltransferase